MSERLADENVVTIVKTSCCWEFGTVKRAGTAHHRRLRIAIEAHTTVH